MIFKMNKKVEEKNEADENKLPTKMSLEKGIPTLHDLLAPDGFDFTPDDYSKVGSKYVRTYAIVGYPVNVQVGWLDELISYNGELDTSIHIWPADDRDAIEQINTQITKYSSQLIIEEEKGSHRNITRLQNTISDLYRQRERLEMRLERLYYVSIFLNLYCDSLDKLEKESVLLENRLKGRGIILRNMMFRQKDSFKTVLPFAINYIEDLYRNFDSGALTATFPFYNADISHPNGIMIGVNLETNAPVTVDFYNRKLLKNGNVCIFAPAGAGKTVLLMTIIIRDALHGVRHVMLDPEGEYKLLVKWLGGISIPIRTNSPYKINPCDLEEEIDSDTNKVFVNIDEKVGDVLNLIAVMVGGLEPDIRAIIASTIKDCYIERGFNADPKSLYEEEPVLDPVSGNYQHRGVKKSMPTISEIHAKLEEKIDALQSKMDVTSLMKVVIALKAFTKGQIYDLFDGETSPELQNFKDNPLISFDLSGLEESILRPVGLYSALSWAWEKFLKKNPGIKKRVVVDEGWMFLNKHLAGSQFTGVFLETVSRRSRKRGSGLVIASQSYDEFTSDQGKAVLKNAETTILLQQSATDIDEIQELFKLSDGERDFISTCQVGEGLIKFKSMSAAFYNYLFPNEKEIIESCNPSNTKVKKGA